MTTLLLPTGTSVELEDLNLHDLRQYYIYQMDMIIQAEGVMASLGIDSWMDSKRTAPTKTVVAKQTTPAQAFQAPPAPGNQMPSYYDLSQWQGTIEVDGRRLYPEVGLMTKSQLLPEIKYQQGLLEQFQAGTKTLVNFASNLAKATQPPMEPMDL